MENLVCIFSNLVLYLHKTSDIGGSLNDRLSYYQYLGSFYFAFKHSIWIKTILIFDWFGFPSSKVVHAMDTYYVALF